MDWFSPDADKTYIAWGGIAIGIIVVIGLMILHSGDKEKDLLSGEHIMAMIAMPSLMLTYAVGHKAGQAAKENEMNKTQKGGDPDADT